MIKVIFGDARDMHEVKDKSVGLVLTSPPYYNAPFDFPGLYTSYDEYLQMLRDVAKEIYRVLDDGRVAVFVVADMRVDGVLYPIPADLIKIMQSLGFKYQDKIIWEKAGVYVKTSNRSGVLKQHPYPLYYYPDPMFEEILIFRKPGQPRIRNKEESKLDVKKLEREKVLRNIWQITHILPQNELTEYTAPFPEELARRIIMLYSYVGDVVLDPFLGSGTTLYVAKSLRRHGIGYEIDLELEPVIRKRLSQATLFGNDEVEIIKRADARTLRSVLRERIDRKLKEKERRTGLPMRRLDSFY